MLVSEAASSTPLLWQDDAWSRLLMQMDQGHLPHAIIVTGPQHAGKFRFAMAFARLLLCHAPVGGHSCGKCHGCELSISGNHGDFALLSPEGKSRVIKVDQVREVVEFVTKTANFGARKVVIVSPAEAMHRSAANALLKSLEEPSAGTHIILVCHRVQAVPATIRSRCQPVALVMPARDASLSWLDQFTPDRAGSELALDLADGQVLLAARFVNEASIDHELDVRRALDKLTTADGSVTDLAALMAEQPLDDLLLQLNRYLHRQAQSMPPAVLTSKPGRQLFELMDDIIDLQRTVASGANPNRQLLIDTLSARFEMVLV